MEFNSAFKGLKLLKRPGNGRLNNLNEPVLNVLIEVLSFTVAIYIYLLIILETCYECKYIVHM